MTITEFITARLDEWEATALAASGSTVSRWATARMMPVPTGDEWEAVGNNPGGYETEVLVALRPGLERPPKVMEGYWGAIASWPDDEHGEELPIAAHIAANDPARVLATIAAHRAIVKFHEDWPVLAETQPTFGPVVTEPDDLINSITFRVSQQMAWLTEQQYRDKFGTEPPTTPMLRALAAIWADHDDYEGWKP